MNRVVVPFECKVDEPGESGTFTGFASTYNNIDLTGDVIMPGAFKSSLVASHGKVFLFADHDVKSRAGTAFLEDDSKGLRMQGKINLEKQIGRDLYSDLLHYKATGISMGLSIGFFTKKDQWKNGVREITEADVKEVSLCSYPANEKARVETVKQEQEELNPDAPQSEVETPDPPEPAPQPDPEPDPAPDPAPEPAPIEPKAASFSEIFSSLELWAMRSNITSALWESVESYVYGYGMANDDTDDAEKFTAIKATLKQHDAAVIEWATMVMARQKSAPSFEVKIGKVLSKRTRKRIDDALAALKDLIAEVDGDEEDAKALPAVPAIKAGEAQEDTEGQDVVLDTKDKEDAPDEEGQEATTATATPSGSHPTSQEPHEKPPDIRGLFLDMQKFLRRSA